MFELVPNGFYLDVDLNGKVQGFASDNGDEYIPLTNRSFDQVNDILGGILKSHLNKSTKLDSQIQVADLAGGIESRAALFVAQHWPNTHVYNIDPVVNTSTATSNFTPIKAFVEDLDKYFLDNSFNLIYSSYLFTNYDSFASLAKRAQILEIVARKLAPCGLALINDLDYEIPSYLPQLRSLMQSLPTEQGIAAVKIIIPGPQDLLLMRKKSNLEVTTHSGL